MVFPVALKYRTKISLSASMTSWDRLKAQYNIQFYLRMSTYERQSWDISEIQISNENKYT